jgi:hypothetical protein
MFLAEGELCVFPCMVEKSLTRRLDVEHEKFLVGKALLSSGNVTVMGCGESSIAGFLMRVFFGCRCLVEL